MMTGGNTNNYNNSKASDDNNVILIENKQGVCVITLNRANKHNAFNLPMYTGLIQALKNADNDDNIKLAIITGNGEYFSTGNDLAITEGHGDLATGADKYAQLLQSFVAAFIDFRKPLIGAVNGPAIGIGATILALMDAIWASDSAYFYTPFTALGQSPEACSSHTFPAIMGTIRANEMLMFNHKMGAQEALEYGFVSRVVPKQEFRERVEEWVFGAKGLLNISYPKSMQTTKQLLRSATKRRILREINGEECRVLRERWFSDECLQGLQKFFTRKLSSKL
ncbi:unnamed protein product, partial [Oppiella nova]